MKYLGEEKHVEIKTVSERQVEYIRCDRCHKKILPYRYKEIRNQYVHVHTFHNDWGNDSIDSHEDHDYCPECAKEVVTEYIADMGGSEELELTNEYLYTHETIRGYEPFSDGCLLVTDDRR